MRAAIALSLCVLLPATAIAEESKLTLPSYEQSGAVHLLPQEAAPVATLPLHKRWGFWVSLVGGTLLTAFAVGLIVMLTRPPTPPLTRSDFLCRDQCDAYVNPPAL